MATAELVSAAVEIPSSTDVPAVKPANLAKVKAPKEKKASAAKKPALHPPYFEMINEAITSLKERTGSSQYAISKFIEDKHKAHLPAHFKKLLLVQLRKLTAAGKLTKLKSSYKISSVKPSTASKSKSAVPKPKSVTAGKPKSGAVKLKKAAAKPKAGAVKLKKAAAKPKAGAVKHKVKSAAPKQKAAGRPVKKAKSSVKAAPGKKLAKVVAKKPKTMKKSPAAKK